ncbi:DUF5753 domain-containing protein [Streptomyces sp. NPDC004267]|uniref:DUF5753 domain-containing protein n=1 Tax=Streptomyces sp. NPDC004267 TaxID=3364694 RepID=UPI0036D14F17
MPPRRVITGRSQQPRQRFAEELKRLRLERRLSYRALGAVAGWDGSLFSKMEKGETLGGPEVVQALETYYGVQKDMLLALWELAAGDHTQFRAKYRKYFELEAEAVSVWHHAAGVMPGLFQTKNYARTLMGTGLRNDIDRHVKARLERQERLTGSNPLRYRGLLTETVVRRSLQNHAHWQEQLEHLLEMGDRRNVTIQVVPYSTGLYALSSTDVTFLRLKDGRVVAWLETSFSGSLIEGTADVDNLQFRYDRARDLALSPTDSRKFITRLLEEVKCEPST